MNLLMYQVIGSNDKSIIMKSIFKGSVAVVAYFFMLLFVYAAGSKMFDFENFQVQLAQSPLLSAYAGFISYGVIILELVIAGLLCFNLTRLIGLYASFGLMVAFTVYIYLILNYSDFVPCSCGGILEKMGWREHLIFNIGCIVLALLSIIFIEKQRAMHLRRTAVISSLILVISASGMVALFLSSEYIMKKENNFTRRFPHHPIMEDKAFDLKVNSYYFAGFDKSTIYLGNYTAPLIVTEIDTAFKNIIQYKITLDNDKYNFKSIKLEVRPPYIFVSDGTVPIIFRAKISDKIAKTISFNNIFFNNIQPIDSVSFVFRAINKPKHTQFLGKISIDQESTVKFNFNIIKAQQNGLFDTDGKLISFNNGQKFIYSYYYRNEVKVFDKDLKVLSNYKTIDTISKADIEIIRLKNGNLKMAKPPLLVNGDITSSNNLLFVKSNLIGKHENKKMWQNSSIIDIYNIQDGQYFGSFYLQNRGADKISQILATDRYLFAICGNQIIRYRYAQSVLTHLVKGEAENPKSRQ
ncbi:DoxX family protein [Kaistella sp.]|uniref:DoxX family protein n=1 Tax=Kaistella sp. TaxID=2782235 RepID=UPI003C37C946